MSSGSVESTAALGRWLLLAVKALVAAMLVDYLLATTPVSTADVERPAPIYVDTVTDEGGGDPRPGR